MNPVWELECVTDSAERTRELAAALAPLAVPGDVVLLSGSLGTGKTTFAQGFARGLGVVGPVTSPTFTLVREYPCSAATGVRRLLHADIYRLDSMEEVADLGLAEMVELVDSDDAVEGSIALIEWGEAAAPVLGRDPLIVTISGDPIVTDRRRFSVRGVGEGWCARVSAITRVLHPYLRTPGV